jgi:hypothetical protein
MSILQGPDAYCIRCLGEGRPGGCLICGKEGKAKPEKLPKRRRVDLSHRLKKKRTDLDDRQRELLDILKDEIDDLWKEANIAKWREDRGEYMRLIALIKKKESRLHAS